MGERVKGRHLGNNGFCTNTPRSQVMEHRGPCTHLEQPVVPCSWNVEKWKVKMGLIWGRMQRPMRLVWERVLCARQFGPSLKARLNYQKVYSWVGAAQADVWFQVIALATVWRMNLRGLESRWGWWLELSQWSWNGHGEKRMMGGHRGKGFNEEWDNTNTSPHRLVVKPE